MEKWKSIPGYEMLYEASSEGRIRTSEGKVTSSARFAHRVWKQRILKQKVARNKKGRTDCRVSLWKDGEERTWLVSRLVALTFCDGYSDGLTVNHIDGNPMNNRADNLEWVTLKKNIQEGFRTGLYASQIPCEINGVRYPSLSQAAKAIGRSRGYVTRCIIKGETPVPATGVV